MLKPKSIDDLEAELKRVQKFKEEFYRICELHKEKPVTRKCKCKHSKAGTDEVL